MLSNKIFDGTAIIRQRAANDLFYLSVVKINAGSEFRHATF